LIALRLGGGIPNGSGSPASSPPDQRQKFIKADGTTTEDCNTSNIYTLNFEGQLSVQSGAIYSISNGVTSEPFVPSTSPGSITTTWELSDSSIQWNNELFLIDNGTAALCLDGQTNQVNVYFLTIPPATCTPVFLTTMGCKQILGSEQNFC